MTMCVNVRDTLIALWRQLMGGTLFWKVLGTTFEAYLLVHEGGEKKISIDSVMLLDVTDYKLGVTCMFRVFARSSSPPTLTSNIKPCLPFRKKKKKKHQSGHKFWGRKFWGRWEKQTRTDKVEKSVLLSSGWFMTNKNISLPIVRVKITAGLILGLFSLVHEEWR